MTTLLKANLRKTDDPLEMFEILLHEVHLIIECSFLESRFRSFASISKIKSAPFQSFSDIGKFGNE